jgi:predicted nucleotidyltransferase
MLEKETLKNIINKLVKIYSPIGIYIFGSYAWGEPTENSDIDLLIIVKDSDEKPHRRAVKGFISLKDLNIPKDLIVSTKKEFEQYSSDKTSLFYMIKEKGKKIYEPSV